MSLWAWILVLSVGALNVAFNFQAERAAQSARSWSDGIVSWQFLKLFLIGCASLVALYSLYLHQVTLARGILLMGATSILGGTIFALYWQTKDSQLGGVEEVTGLSLNQLNQSIIVRFQILEVANEPSAQPSLSRRTRGTPKGISLDSRVSKRSAANGP
jgi:hypothetical protein